MGLRLGAMTLLATKTQCTTNTRPTPPPTTPFLLSFFTPLPLVVPSFGTIPDLFSTTLPPKLHPTPRCVKASPTIIPSPPQLYFYIASYAFLVLEDVRSQHCFLKKKRPLHTVFAIKLLQKLID